MKPRVSIFDEIRNNPGFSESNSVSWYQRQIKQLNVRSFDPRLLQDKDRIKSTIVPGFAYMYGYDPKLKEVLPFYDRYPLTFIFSMTGNSFTGLNFHYLPIKARIAMYDTMMEYASNNSYDELTRIKLNWQMVSNVSRFPWAAPAIKMYLDNHVTTRMLRVPIYDLKTAILLPVESFVGASKTAVYNNSALVARNARTKKRKP